MSKSPKTRRGIVTSLPKNERGVISPYPTVVIAVEHGKTRSEAKSSIRRNYIYWLTRTNLSRYMNEMKKHSRSDFSYHAAAGIDCVARMRSVKKGRPQVTYGKLTGIPIWVYENSQSVVPRTALCEVPARECLVNKLKGEHCDTLTAMYWIQPRPLPQKRQEPVVRVVIAWRTGSWLQSF